MEYKFYNICSVYFRFYNFIFCIYYLLVIDSCTPLMETSFCGFRLAWKNKVVLIFLSYLILSLKRQPWTSLRLSRWTGRLPETYPRGLKFQTKIPPHLRQLLSKQSGGINRRDCFYFTPAIKA